MTNPDTTKKTSTPRYPLAGHPVRCAAMTPATARARRPWMSARRARSGDAPVTPDRMTPPARTCAPTDRSGPRAPSAGGLEVEQVLLRGDPARVAGQRAVGPHHPVAGHDDAQRVRAEGRPDRSRRRRPLDGAGQTAVGLPFAVADRAGQCREHAPLERRRQRQVDIEVEVAPAP